MEQAGPAFSSNAQDVIGRHVDVQLLGPAEDVMKEYDVMVTAEWINCHSFKRVALQFPDDTMTQAVEITCLLQKQTIAEIVILADTSYGSCCVDEVAAEHYNCDAIVHYGHACLSPTPGKLPVWFVFGRRTLDVDVLIEKVLPMVVSDPSQPILLLYDTIFYHAVNETVATRLAKQLPNLIVSRLLLPGTGSDADGPCDDGETDERSCFGRAFEQSTSQNAATVLYLGSADSRFLSAVLMTLNHSKCICFDPSSESAVTDFWQPGRALARRYYLVERARDAQRIGILVGTLGVRNYLRLVQKIETVARRAGKAVYRFVVGKLNAPKLANFADIDVFVLVACPENSLLDSKEFYQPIITPFELEIACDSSRQWTGNYELDFKQLFLGDPNDDCSRGSDETETDVSLVTGRIRMLGHRSGVHEEDGGRAADDALVKRNDANALVLNSASNFLANRTWQGLDPQLGKTPVTKAVEGACGIAMHYDCEPNTTSEV